MKHILPPSDALQESLWFSVNSYGDQLGTRDGDFETSPYGLLHVNGQPWFCSRAMLDVAQSLTLISAHQLVLSGQHQQSTHSHLLCPFSPTITAPPRLPP